MNRLCACVFVIIAMFASQIGHAKIGINYPIEIDNPPDQRGYLCRPLGSDQGWPWHLEIGAENFGFHEVVVAEQNHFCRIWMQRYWFEPFSDNKPKLSRIDISNGSRDDLNFVMQIDFLGYGLEGHSTVSLYKKSNEGIVVDDAFGFYTENSDQGFFASFGPRLSRSSKVGIWARDGAVSHLNLAHPSNVELERYRNGLQFYFGRIPTPIAKAIIQNDTNWSRTIFLDQDTYSRLLLAVKNTAASDLALVNSEADYDTNSQAFGRAIYALCEDIGPVCAFERPREVGDVLVYPQHYLGLNLNFNLPHELREQFFTSRNEVFSATTNEQVLFRVNRLTRVQSISTRDDGSTLLEFEPGTLLQINNRPTPIAFFLGSFDENGFAEGQSTLVLGDSAVMDLSISRAARILGGMEDGYLRA